MTGNNEPEKNRFSLSAVTDIAIRLGVLFIIAASCIQILKPFITPIIWGIIYAVAVYPAYTALNSRLGDRRKLTASVMTIVALLVIALPSIQFAISTVDGLKTLNSQLEGKELKLPPPPEKIKEWPVIGEITYAYWQNTSEDLESTLVKFKPQFVEFGKWLLAKSMGAIFGVVMFAASIIIAGILMTNAASGGQLTKDLFVRLAGERGVYFVSISEQTIRSVVKGILGVAVIQALLAGVGFAIAGIPLAGVWASLCLFLAVVQIGIGPVILGVIIYAFSNMALFSAIVLTVYLIIITLGDGPLKAVIMGRGAPVPMATIFLGAIGGFLWLGFLGLFIGAVLLSLGYKLIEAWIGWETKATSL